MIASPIPGAAISSDGFGPRDPIVTPGGTSGSFHYGQDFDVPAWTPIRAAADGRVIVAGRVGTYGYAVYLDHGGGLVTRYAHMIAHPPVAVNWYVEQGDVIGYVGSTGASTGNHLHFEVVINGYRVDPLKYLQATTKAPTPGQIEEDEDMAKNSAFYYTTTDTKTGQEETRYLIVNTTSGFYSEYSNGAGRGAMDGGYNTAIAATLDTGTFAKITASHAAALKASCERVLARA